MRRSILFLCCCLLGNFLFLLPAFAQNQNQNWELLQDLPIRLNRHDDIFFLNAQTGWVANGSGFVFKTTDSGDNWQQLATLPVYFRSIGFASDSLGWAGTLSPDQVLYQSMDGGATWVNVTERINGPAPTGICGLSVVSEEVAFGVGRFNGPPIFIKTTDGGATWESSDLSDYGIGSLIDVHFFDENHGFITGGSESNFTGNAIVAETMDGGATWEVRHRSTLQKDVGGEWGWKISFPTPTTGYVSVEYPFANTTGVEARVLKTTNAGQTWSELSVDGSTEPAGLQGLGFVSENVGWASGRGVSSVTLDGGETWAQVEDLDGLVNRFRLVNDTLAFAVGRRAYRWQGESIVTALEELVERPRKFTLAQNYPNPFNPSTTIQYTLHEPAQVRVRILNILSQEVRLLMQEHQSTGTHEVVWDGRDNHGNQLASGTYLYLIDIGEVHEMKKMVLLK